MESVSKIEYKYLPTEKVSFYAVTNMPTIISEVSINYKMTTQKICHEMTTPMEA